MACWHHKAV